LISPFTLQQQTMSTTHALFACATCRPEAGSVIALAQDSAVVVMLAALLFIFTIVFYAIFSFARRQRRVLEAEAALQ
jgi:hypothetical protein